MIYKYDKKALYFKSIFKRAVIAAITFLILIVTTTTCIVLKAIKSNIIITEETKSIILKEQNEFSQSKLKEYILELNIKFPYIVLAQAELETGGFTSKIFKENKNLFGMKVATKRPSTAQGSESGHAFYNTWRESVVDMGFYSAQYLSHIKSESEYFEYLKQNYAEDSSYVFKLKQIISKKDLKSLVD